uniref:Uncharacterized protein n=1 Tax=Aureoumbra lagunensis TaxID=44058 RepID=A0A7S3JX97_9STRA|mmetsp:Transcript_8733/g.12121  ORF Transcript_8733/g.12121 Transcript_8733/m.12121 type:complete len:330 (-) Transcript_8733:544-1533(-)
MNATFKKKQELVVAAAEKTPESVRAYIVKLAPIIALVGTILEVSVPYMIKIYNGLIKLYKILEPYHPEDMAYVFLGLCMAFFGGIFPALITAVEAYRQVGFASTLRALKVLYDDCLKVQEASKKDDKIDADKDGIPDVEQVEAHQLVERKVLLFLKTTDPKAVSDALAAITSGWLSVLASLRIKFARAITLGAAIGDVLRKPATRYLSPFLHKVVPPDYERWIIPGINYTCKFIAMTIAWTIQSIISAFHSAVRGGQLAAKGTVAYLHKYGFISIDDSHILVDEVVGYVIAALGFFVQARSGFHLPFPLNIIFLPFRILEFVIVWTIMG